MCGVLLILLTWLGATSCDIIDDVAGELIDMSHDFDENTIFYDGRRYFNMTTFAIIKGEGYWAKCNKFCSVEHGGTHIDAPNHFTNGTELGATTVGELPLRQLIGPAVIINAVEKAKKNRDYEVTVSDLEEWEKKNGIIPDRAMIFLNTGWAVRWPNAEQVFGEEVFKTNFESRSVHYPGLSIEAAQWLVKNRPKMNGIGLDTPSLDHGPSKTFPVHVWVLGHNYHILENVANLDKVPNGATVFAMPIKIAKGTGGPTRVFAVVPMKSIAYSTTMFTYIQYVIIVAFTVIGKQFN